MYLQNSYYGNFKISHKKLKDAQKTRTGISPYSAYVNRPIGRIFAAAFYQTSATPNHVTGIGAILTFGSLLWLAFFANGVVSGVVVGVGLLLGFAIDSADGQLARLQGSSSLLGEWLDHTLDNTRISVMHVATLVFLLRVTDIGPSVLILACGVFLISSASIFFGGVVMDQLARGRAHRDAVIESERQPVPSRFKSLALLPVDYGITCLSYLLLPWPQVFFVVYSLLAVLHLMLLPVLTVRWALRLKAQI